MKPAAPSAPLRVLLVEGQPRWEYRYLKNALLRDPGVLLQSLLLSADPEYVQEHSPGAASLTRLPDGPELRQYDVIVLGDVAEEGERTPRLYPGAFETIGAAVRDGVGLLVIDGQRSNRAWSANPLGALLPVRFASSGPRVLEAGPYPPERPTPADEALHLEDDPAADARVWAELPPFYALVPVQRTTTDASVLLSARLSSGGARPILATRRDGGVVAWLGVDETWRWRAEVGDRYMVRFYGQLLRAIVAGSRAPAPADERIRDRSGREVAVRIQAITRQDADWVVVTRDGRRTPLAAVEHVRLSAAEPRQTGAALVLRDGSLLRGTVGSGGGVRVNFACDALGPASVDFDAILALVLDTSPEGALDPTRWRPVERDRIVLRDASLPIEGVLTGVDRHEVRLETEFGHMTLPLDRIGRVDWAALELAPTTKRTEGPRAKLRLDDGTTTWCTLVELNADVLRAHHDVLGPLEVARRRVLTVELE